MRLLVLLALAGSLTLIGAVKGFAASHTRPAVKQNNAVEPTTPAGVLALIRISMPPAPDGWVEEQQAPESVPTPTDPADIRLSFTITYRRVSGVEEETKKAEETYNAVVTAVSGSGIRRAEELRRKLADTERAFEKARKRKEIGRERKLKKELSAIESRLRALPAENEQQVNNATDPFLVRDKLLAVHISLNEPEVNFPNAAAFSRPKAAFALRRESRRDGPTGWREGRTLLLYGDWQELQPDLFHARIGPDASIVKPESIVLEITGEEKRVDQFIKKADMRSIIGLLH